MPFSLTDCICTHIDSFRQGLCDALGTPVSKKFRGRKCVRFIFTHSSPAQKKLTGKKTEEVESKREA